MISVSQSTDDKIFRSHSECLRLVNKGGNSDTLIAPE